MDRLATMFNKQLEFQNQLRAKEGKPELSAMTSEEMAEFFRTHSLSVMFELGEASNEIGWKPWATSRHLNREAYMSEIIDAWHFLMNLWLLADGTPEEFFETYLTKQAKNRKRQSEGYDGVTGKCSKCKKSYDDAGVRCYPSNEHEAAWCDTHSVMCLPI